MFSSTFMAVMVYASLGWCAITTAMLLSLLFKEMKRGMLW